ncbi:MAG: CDP-diacylglycerol--glycerol-3-phosphate 3-phosphatidyltransferase [Oscillospiraceae bacterium]|jgi:CDP-diacylglycerol--glycerol-3-phosphate 3-phosphatidyltransferase
MNLPNKLTVLRVVMIPLFLVFLLIKAIPVHYFLSLGVFAIASITDTLDGMIARKYNLITNFGKFLDPLADKVLVMAAIIAFVELKLVSALPVIIILAREFLVTSLRLVANKNGGKVIAAGFLGKLKTAFTMIAIVAILFLHGLEEVGVDTGWDILLIGEILIWLATALTLISGVKYLYDYRDQIDPTK